MKIFPDEICLYMFLSSVVLFLCFLHGEYVKSLEEKRKDNILTQENTYHRTNQNASTSTATDDRLITLYKMLETAAAQETAQQAKIEKIKQLNQYGIVVNEKNEKRAYDELYRMQLRKISIENQIQRTIKTGK